MEYADIHAAFDCVPRVSASDHNPQPAVAGAAIFAGDCTSCHGESGLGGYKYGAPRLVEAAWIYGDTREELHHTIHSGQSGVMPGWHAPLTDEEIKKLTLYVLWAGQDAESADGPG